MTPEDSARIDAWVDEQMRKPWPLSSTQLAVIRDALGDSALGPALSDGVAEKRNRPVA